MNYENYIKSELLTLLPVLYLLGCKLKKSNFPDKFIPLILGVVSIFLCTLWVVSTTDISGLPQIASALFTSITQGILIAGTCVYANQIYVQSKKEN